MNMPSRVKDCSTVLHPNLPNALSNHHNHCLTGYPPRPPSGNTPTTIEIALDTLGVFVHKVNVENTYEGDPFLVTVADYDASFTSDSSYDEYGIVYNDRSQVL